VQDFLARGRELLSRPASSAEDIASAGATAGQLVEGLPAVVALRRRVEEKNRLLRQMAAAAGGASAAAAQLAPLEMSEVRRAAPLLLLPKEALVTHQAPPVGVVAPLCYAQPPLQRAAFLTACRSGSLRWPADPRASKARHCAVCPPAPGERAVGQLHQPAAPV
jgi:hypothetical protein